MISNENFNQLCTLTIGDCYIDLWTSQYGGRFGHTTPKGHQLIADNVYAQFLKNKTDIERQYDLLK